MGKKKYSRNRENEEKIDNSDMDENEENDLEYYSQYCRELFDIEKLAKQILDALPQKKKIKSPNEKIDEPDKLQEDQTINGLNEIRIGLQNVNFIREELIKLDLNLEARVYYEQEVFPILNTLSILSFAVERYSISAQALSAIPLTKSSDICDIIDLAYDSAELSEDVLKLLEIKVKKLIQISKKCKR